ncbi:low affinity immunoglobulin gamma Fc region receptor II-a-like isoform X1 [Takifugu rubripes]|uniref:low affinity immunoglobulin gamma Fc region receptor II-a-like isoform X1 n=1 Tax=Takifugu rubripes TaxID=31033 RepID=UPI00114539F9|nr:low affinity immunoglobulin gamma Fc region receptor II-a-like isoform X1 [Takifugu rubripes]XP_029695916.1 low affinity immunoglobulin gamma Fc region receptor II-a-like isoform X1 [Takifugu rubripes]
MELTTFCTVVATLQVSPNRSQFFQYDELFLSCDWPGNSSRWTVMKNTSQHTNQPCSNHNRGDEPSYYFAALYESDSGVYWCQSAAGERSHAINITVTGGPVILESPALPVAEGSDVTLRCRAKTPSASTQADFFKDGALVKRSHDGNMTIRSISRAEGGVYKCNTSGAGHSAESQLTVLARAERCDPPDPRFLRLLLPVVVLALLLVALLLLCTRRNHTDVDEDVPYTDVTFQQEVQPDRIKELDTEATNYSTVKTGGTDRK